MLFADGTEEVNVMADVSSFLDANVADGRFATAAKISLQLVAVLQTSRTARITIRLLSISKRKLV